MKQKEKSHLVKNVVEEIEFEPALTNNELSFAFGWKELAENAEKGKLKERKIDDLKSQIDESNDEMYNLQKKIDQKYDLIEDMEHEIEKNEENSNEAKKELYLKERKLKALENLIRRGNKHSEGP